MSAVWVFTNIRCHGLRQTCQTSSHPRTLKNTRAFSATSASRFNSRSPSLGNNAKSALHGKGAEGGMLRMIMFGKPGAGKGTLSARLVKKYDIISISTGDLLRQHIAHKTDIGKQAEEIVARGDLLPDELVLRVVTSKLDHLQDKHWILDGFPRTIGQGELLDAHLRLAHTPLTLLATLAVPLPFLRARIAGRFVHAASGRVYNLDFNPPRLAGLDDLTGEPLVQRPDDRPEVYERRLQAYERETAPLLGYYTARAASESAGGMGGAGLRVVSFAGETSDEMWPVLEQTVRDLFPSVKVREEIAGGQAQTRRLPGAKSSDAVALLATEPERRAGAAEKAVDTPFTKIKSRP